ncbi:hypothetical protein Hanom_Chr09g00792721 [Helianthus anomalus]
MVSTSQFLGGGGTYPSPSQTAADAPADYITLYANFFMTWAWFVLGISIFVVVLKKLSPRVDQFGALYQLQCNLGFYSLSVHSGAKKILLAPPKSYYDWKRKFFFIRNGVIPIAMSFHAPREITKETLPIPKVGEWYKNLCTLPNR